MSYQFGIIKVLIKNEPKLGAAKVIMNNQPKIIIIAVVAILAIAGGIGFWYWSKSKQAPPAHFSQTQEALSLGSEIFDKTQNPLRGQVPDANPFKGQKNPLDAIYQNPFE